MFFFQVYIFFLAQQAEEDKAREAKEKAEKAEKEQREKDEAEALKQAQIEAVKQKLTAELRQAKVQADRDKQALRSVKDTGKQKVTQHRLLIAVSACHIFLFLSGAARTNRATAGIAIHRCEGQGRGGNRGD